MTLSRNQISTLSGERGKREEGREGGIKVKRQKKKESTLNYFTVTRPSQCAVTSSCLLYSEVCGVQWNRRSLFFSFFSGQWGCGRGLIIEQKMPEKNIIIHQI